MIKAILLQSKTFLTAIYYKNCKTKIFFVQAHYIYNTEQMSNKKQKFFETKNKK